MAQMSLSQPLPPESLYTKKHDTKVYLLSVGVSSTSKDELLTMIESQLLSKADQRAITIVTPNPEQVVLAQSSDAFRDSLNTATIAVPDGIGLVWALNKTGKHADNPGFHWQRMPGIELAQAIVSAAANVAAPVLFLGGKAGVAVTAAKACSNSIPGLMVYGMSGFENRAEPTTLENQEIFNTIKSNQVKVVLVGLGAPWQELWISEQRAKMEALGVKVVMAVGGSFDIWGGKLSRAPKLWRDLGLEWLWRLLLEPWRITRQYNLIRFVWLVLTRKPLISSKAD